MVSVVSKPYVSVTSISQLLAGQAFCEFKPWFMAHHQDYERQPSTFNGAAWRAKHAQLVREAAAWQRGDGSTLLVEAQNKFVVSGKSGTTVTGQPDLVRTGVGMPLVTDCKTGQPADGHIGQVMCYMLLLPYVRPEYHDLQFAGRLQYQDHVVDIPASAVDDKFKEQFRRLMGVVSADQAPEPTPSEWECRYCSITAHDCPARIEARDSDAGGTWNSGIDLF